MRVERFLEQSAARFPGKTAVVAGEQRLNYAELDQLANRWAHLLLDRGVGQGERVLNFMENGTNAVAGMFAILKAGAVLSPVNPTTKAEKLAYVVNNCKAQGIITNGRLLPVAAEAIKHTSSVRVILLADDSVASDGSLEVPCAPPVVNDIPNDKPRITGIDQDLATLIYTSGSTGFPKGVMMTHQNVVTAADSIAEYLENSSDDVVLNVLPLSFGYGMYQAIVSAKVGGTLVLLESFAYPYRALEEMRRHRVTGFPLVPTMAAILLQMKDLRPGQFPDLRYMTNAAAALPVAHLQRLGELFSTTRFYSMYGMTECTRGTYLPPEQLKIRPGSVGKAIPNTEAYVVDDQGRRLGPGEVGQLVIRGGHVMKGYWNDPESTEHALRAGPNPWEKVLCSGDLFRTDEEGYLYFVSRATDVIKTGGQKVSPKEIENVLYTIPGIREAAVVGVPDPVLGQAIHAVVVVGDRATVTAQEILGHCARHLEDFMVPRVVHFRKSLPKTESGKIRRIDITLESSIALSGA